MSSVVAGFNATCFAYGMTGAGKTHTMFGSMCLPNVQEQGIVPLALTDLFTNAKLKPGTCLIKLSYLEIYNEMVRDLLSSKVSSRAQGLLLVEDPERGVIASDLTEYTVSSPQEVGKLLLEGNTRRTMAPTGANQFSSRSHAVLQFSLEVRTETKETGRQVCVSKLCLIDLAGCERAAATANRGVRLFEGANINRSLLALGNCINILSDPEKAGRFVPYRDSKLTRLLKDALGGRTRTVMLACVSPTDSAFEETLHTLKYAERARRIKVSASRNVKEVLVHVSEYKAIIAALRAEVESLKEEIRLKDCQLSLISPNSPPALDGDSLDLELRRNFEEFWELKQSIYEVETLNEENKRQIRALVADLEYVQSISDAGEETRLKGEINRLHHTVRANEEEIKTLLGNLQVNLKAKTALQKQLSSLQTDRQLDILQLEITVRSLKMEKMDLYVQNQEMRQRMANSQKLSEEKERTIVALRLEVEEMKKQAVGNSARMSEIDVRSEGVSPHDIDTSSSAHMHSSRQSSTSFTLASPQDHSTDVKLKPLFLSDLHQVRALRKFEKVTNRSESAESFVSNYGNGGGSRGDEAMALLKDVKEQLGDEETDSQPVKHSVKVSLLSPKVQSKRSAQKQPVKTAYSELLRARSTSNTQKHAKGRAVVKATPVKPQVGHLANLLATLRGVSAQEEPVRPTPMVVVSLKGARAKS